MLDWNVYRAEMMWGEYVRVTYFTKLDTKQSGQFYTLGLSQVPDFQTETEMIRKFAENGFKVVDPNQIRQAHAIWFSVFYCLCGINHNLEIVLFPPWVYGNPPHLMVLCMMQPHMILVAL